MVSSVIAVLACPSISETTLGSTFLDSRSAAHACRRSWKRMSTGRPARSRTRANERLRRFEGLMIPPVSLAKTRPPGL